MHNEAHAGSPYDRPPTAWDRLLAWTKGPTDLLVARECEAFLTGRYVQQARSLGWPLAPWMWLNQLAHASPAEIRLLAAGRRSRGTIAWWTPVVDRLAVEVLHVADDDDTIREVQRTVIQPLELHALDRLHEPRTIGDLAEAVLSGLNRFRGRRHRDAD